MNSISKVNNFNFPRILVRRTILNWRITPESTAHIYRIKGGGGSGHTVSIFEKQVGGVTTRV